MTKDSFVCTLAGCTLAGQAVPSAIARALKGNCPECGGRLVELEPEGSPSETAQRVIATYPYPIALPMWQLHEKVDVEARAKGLVDVLTSLLKYLSMVLQSEYLRSDLVDEQLTSIRWRWTRDHSPQPPSSSVSSASIRSRTSRIASRGSMPLTSSSTTSASSIPNSAAPRIQPRTRSAPASS